MALYVLAMVTAVLATDLGPILAIAGAVGGSCLLYIGPVYAKIRIKINGYSCRVEV
jgi:hypothetical protein